MTALLAPPRAAAIEAATRREFIALLGAAGLLTACGNDDDSDAQAAGNRTVEDVYGNTVDIPQAPERIVALGGVVLANLIAIGVDPTRIVGFTKASFDREDDYLTRLVGFGPLTDVGSESELNIEAVLALRPDLMLYPVAPDGNPSEDRTYQSLRAGGVPVVAVSLDYDRFEGYQQIAREIGAAVGRSGETEVLLADLDARFADLRARLDALPVTPSVTVLRASAGSQLSSRRNLVLSELGVPGNRPDAETFSVDVSGELLDQIAADHIVVFVDADADDAREQLGANPLWGRLEAVQAGRVSFVDNVAWNEIDLVATGIQLDDIERALLDR